MATLVVRRFTSQFVGINLYPHGFKDGSWYKGQPTTTTDIPTHYLSTAQTGQYCTTSKTMERRYSQMYVRKTFSVWTADHKYAPKLRAGGNFQGTRQIDKKEQQRKYARDQSRT